MCKEMYHGGSGRQAKILIVLLDQDQALDLVQAGERTGAGARQGKSRTTGEGPPMNGKTSSEKDHVLKTSLLFEERSETY